MKLSRAAELNSTPIAVAATANTTTTAATPNAGTAATTVASNTPNSSATAGATGGTTPASAATLKMKRGRKLKPMNAKEDTGVAASSATGGAGGGGGALKKKKRGRKIVPENQTTHASTSEEDEECSAVNCVRPEGNFSTRKQLLIITYLICSNCDARYHACCTSNEPLLLELTNNITEILHYAKVTWHFLCFLRKKLLDHVNQALINIKFSLLFVTIASEILCFARFFGNCRVLITL